MSDAMNIDGSDDDPLGLRQAARMIAIKEGVLVLLENTSTYLHVHDPDTCWGETCTVHNRSDHHMRSWPQNWRGDRGLMERLCPDNGVGHPDPDEIHLDRDGRGVHGCDGCCHE